MTKKAIPQIRLPESKPQLTRITQLLRRVQPFLLGTRERFATSAEMEEWTGVAERTIRDWFANIGRPTAEFVVQLLERLPEKARHELLDAACRCWPTLEHPRLGCDQALISRLKTIACQGKGFTFINGSSDENRSFMLTAMGHSFLSLTERPHRVGGIDVHEHDWFVPVPGVNYLHNVFHPGQVRAAVRQVWPKIRAGKPQLLLINHIWAAVPEMHNELRAMAARCHVMIAQAETVEPAQPRRRLAQPANIITVSAAPENRKDILVEIQAI